MKFLSEGGIVERLLSLPVRGAWIEISNPSMIISLYWSLPVRGAWIEIISAAIIAILNESLPVRGAWIEISLSLSSNDVTLVAPRKGSVD